jgi:cell division septum initiation protein DivIVA
MDSLSDDYVDSRLSSERHPRPPMRYRRFGGGYRREDVEFALASLRLTLRQLENDLEALREEAHALEEDLRSTRAELDGYRGREGEISNTMALALRRATEIDEAAEERARAIVASAEDAAARARADAHKRIEETGNQFGELLRMKDNLLEQMRAIVSDFETTISQVERKELTVPALPVETVPAEAPQPELEPIPDAVELESAREPESEAATEMESEPQVELESIAELVPPEPETEPEPAIAEPEPEPEPVPEPPPAAAMAGAPTEMSDDQLFEAKVELDAGPFADFGSLSAFERALALLPRVEDVYVRRLAADRALIELTLGEEGPLIAVMRESLPYAFAVRGVSSTKLVLDVTSPDAAENRVANSG